MSYYYYCSIPIGLAIAIAERKLHSTTAVVDLISFNCFLFFEHGDVIPLSNEELPMLDSPSYLCTKSRYSCLDSSTYGWLAKIGHEDQPWLHRTLRLQVHELYNSRVYNSNIGYEHSPRCDSFYILHHPRWKIDCQPTTRSPLLVRRLVSVQSASRSASRSHRTMPLHLLTRICLRFCLVLLCPHLMTPDLQSRLLLPSPPLYIGSAKVFRRGHDGDPFFFSTNESH